MWSQFSIHQFWKEAGEALDELVVGAGEVWLKNQNPQKRWAFGTGPKGGRKEIQFNLPVLMLVCCWFWWQWINVCMPDITLIMCNATLGPYSPRVGRHNSSQICKPLSIGAIHIFYYNWWQRWDLLNIGDIGVADDSRTIDFQVGMFVLIFMWQICWQTGLRSQATNIENDQLFQWPPFRHMNSTGGEWIWHTYSIITLCHIGPKLSYKLQNSFI